VNPAWRHQAARLAGVLAWTMAPLAAADPGTDPLSFDRRVEPLLETYCYSCHNDEKTKGDIDLKQDHDLRQIIEHRLTWRTALKKLRAEEMPPPKAKAQPDAPERAILIGFIDRTVNHLDCSEVADPGASLARRLSRAEYDNSMRDLLGLDLGLSAAFPADSTSHGFDTIGAALTMPPLLAERYYEAATTALDALWQDRDALARILVVMPGSEHGEGEAARRIIARFAARAYRHPVPPEHLDALLTLFTRARASGLPFPEAVRPMLQAVLISPRFLVRLEENRPGETGAYAVGAFDLATRLSYLMWSSPPDDELLSAAAADRLAAPGELEAQARRMLADPRAKALVVNFAAQWLQLPILDKHRPDAQRFPEYTPALGRAMADEAMLFLDEVMRQDRPITDLIDADYTYLNGDLARLYGIDGVEGPAMRRVQLSDHRRGGILTMAAVLTLTADPARTNIPRRGDYLLGTILGEPPPPPPPVIPALEEAAAALGPLTVREMIDLHRRNPECAFCHAKIDPLGIGLENFDAIGRWQDRQSGKPIDAAGTLPGGAAFDGPVALKRLLLARKPEFARAMASQLLTYALGRGLIVQDDCVVTDALNALERGAYRFSAMLVTVVTSYPFTHRRNPDL
jgi:hypothetical protein